MANVTLGGNPATLRGELPTVGEKAPDFRYVKDDLSEGQLSGINAQATVLIAVPSLDTRVCAMETRKFNAQLDSMAGVSGLVLSMDLPFAMKRFCEMEGIQTVASASDFRFREFGSQYNVEIIDGPFQGLLARAVFVLDSDQVIRYAELVPEIGQEPDYDKVLEAVKSLVA